MEPFMRSSCRSWTLCSVGITKLSYVLLTLSPRVLMQKYLHVASASWPRLTTLLCTTPFNVEVSNLSWQHIWGGELFYRSVTVPSKRGGATTLSNFWGSPLSQTTLFKEERPIRSGNTCMLGWARYYAVSRALRLMAAWP